MMIVLWGDDENINSQTNCRPLVFFLFGYCIYWYGVLTIIIIVCCVCVMFVWNLIRNSLKIIKLIGPTTMMRITMESWKTFSDSIKWDFFFISNDDDDSFIPFHLLNSFCCCLKYNFSILKQWNMVCWSVEQIDLIFGFLKNRNFFDLWKLWVIRFFGRHSHDDDDCGSIIEWNIT